MSDTLLEISDLRSNQINCTICVAKMKALISCAVTAVCFLHRQNAGFLIMQLTS